MHKAIGWYKYLLVFTVFVVGLLTGQTANAQNQYTSSSGNNLFGQAQAYDVILRGDGSMIVNARFMLSNNEDQAKSKYSYSQTNGKLREVSAYQEISCYGLPTLYVPQPTTTSPSSSSGSSTSYNTQSYATTTNLPECYTGYNNSKNNSQSSQRYFPPSSNLIYKKVDTKISDNNFELSLPQVIESGKNTNIVMVYNVAGISSKKLGVYNFDFVTLKTSERTTSADIAISTDEGYYLSDTNKAQTNYKNGSNNLNLNTSIQSSGDTANSVGVQNYVKSIGSNGYITKTANQILPSETFSVKGKFASNKFLLNWQRTFLLLAIGLLIVGLIIFWYVHRRRRLIKQEAAQQGSNTDNLWETKSAEYQGQNDTSETKYYYK